jgi:hypothetical protein
VLTYSVLFQIWNGIFYPKIEVEVLDVTSGIKKLVPTFEQRLSDSVRTAVLAAASPAVQQINATIEKQRVAALHGKVADGLNLDLRWQLISYGFVPFQPIDRFLVLNAAESKHIFEPTSDLFPCQEVAPTFKSTGIPASFAFNARVYPPGMATPLRLTAPLIDVNPESFALDMEYEGAPLHASLARALHTRLRQSSPEVNAWWIKTNALCTQLLSGELKPPPPPLPPFDPSKCPKTPGHDAEPIDPRCKDLK